MSWQRSAPFDRFRSVFDTRLRRYSVRTV